jgi:hypothetical protein
MDERSKELDTLETVARGRVAIGVPEAGKLFGLGRDASYKAAKCGELPTIRFGRREMVLVALLRRLIVGDLPHQTVNASGEGNPWDEVPNYD